MLKPIRLSLFLLVAMMLAACNVSLASDITPPPGYVSPTPIVERQVDLSGPLYPLVPPDPRNGAVIYAEKCAPCHGVNGLGDGELAVNLPSPPPPLGDAVVARQALPADWYRMVTVGNLANRMPPFSSLTDRERWDVVAYALELSLSPAQLAEAEEIYAVFCEDCHGAGGAGDGSQMVLQPGSTAPDFGDLDRMAGLSQSDLFNVISQGVQMSMPGFESDLDENQRWGLAAYVRQFAFASGGDNRQEASVSTPVPDAPTELLAGVGTVQGTLVNGSGGETPAGVEVFLHGFDEMNNIISDTTKTAVDGSFIFEAVEMPEGRAFLATVQYAGATYGSDFVSVEAGMSTVDLPIMVYDSITDPSSLVVDRLHLFFEFLDDQTVRVAELYIISNPTNKALVALSETEPALKFSLPAGYSNLQFQEGTIGDRYLQTEDGFGDLAVVQPGQGVYQVLFAYEMPYDRKLELQHRITLTTQAVVVLVPADTVKVKGEGLEVGQTSDVEGMNFQQYTAGSLSPGDMLSLTVTGKPVKSTPTVVAGSQRDLLIGLAVLGVVLVGAGVWLYRRNQASLHDNNEVEIEEGRSNSVAAAQDTPESIMDAILALDDLYAAGQLPEEAYRQRRGELKTRLKNMLGD